MGNLNSDSTYESLRIARISENMARLTSLGLDKSITELRTLASPSKTSPSKRKCCRKVYDYSSLRRSNRLISQSESVPRRSTRLNGTQISSLQGKGGISKQKEWKSFEAEERELEERNKISSDALSRRCDSRSRGSLYNPVFGICCHFCRQKKLCGEEDCKHCGDLDNDQPCIGKTSCSVCNSSNGVLCRACLKVRYGEELEEVRANKEWMCPHCIESNGIRPYWICNSSFCLKKRKMVPTGIAIFEAREMGYASVAHFLMDKLQKKGLTN